MALRNYAESFSANGYTGSGKTTAEIAQSNNASPEASSGVQNNAPENVMGAWLMVAGVLVVIAFLAEKFSVGQTYGLVKLSFYNMVVLTLYVVLGMTLGKVFFTKVKVPGISVLFTSV